MSLTTRSIFSFSATLKACVGLSAVSTCQPSAQKISRSSSHESRSSSTTRICFIDSPVQAHVPRQRPPRHSVSPRKSDESEFLSRAHFQLQLFLHAQKRFD